MTERTEGKSMLVAIAANDRNQDSKSQTPSKEEEKYGSQEDSYGSCGWFGRFQTYNRQYN